MKIEDALRGVSSALLDTAPAIYYLEKNPLFGPVMDRFFQIRAVQQITLVTSPITLAECLMLPIRQGRKDLEAAYQALITAGQGDDLLAGWRGGGNGAAGFAQNTD